MQSAVLSEVDAADKLLRDQAARPAEITHTRAKLALFIGGPGSRHLMEPTIPTAVHTIVRALDHTLLKLPLHPSGELIRARTTRS